MRMSRLFLRTLRDDPADAEVPSHRLLVRAGYVRRAAPGIYSWLPLGLKVLGRVEAIVREEMDAIGAQEVRFPALLPREPYEVTNRWTEYGPNLFRLADRRGNDMLLGPTHEEMFTLLVKDLYSSYKDLPLTLYQIQTKYRDEARPRAGILRGREFVMKDSYSFDIDDAGLEASYQAHREAYVRIFDRLGFEYVIVQADSGAMGGSASEEFLVVAETGEDTFVRSPGGYAANVEAVTTVVPEALPLRRRARRARRADPRDADDRDAGEPPERGVPARRPRVGGGRHPQERAGHPPVPGRHPRAAGDRPARRPRRRREAPRDAGGVRPRSTRSPTPTSRPTPTLAKGYIGPGVLGEKQSTGIRYLVDPRVVTGTRWVTGADVDGSHVLDLVAGRDFTPDGTIEAAEVRAGDPAPDGSGPLEVARGHRDGPHLPARPQVRRGARPPGARRERQARHRHDGLVRRRGLACGRRRGRELLRRAGHRVATRDRAVRRPPRRHRQGRRGVRGRRRPWSPSSRPTASRSSTTTAARSRRA